MGRTLTVFALAALIVGVIVSGGLVSTVGFTSDPVTANRPAEAINAAASVLLLPDGAKLIGAGGALIGLAAALRRRA